MRPMYRAVLSNSTYLVAALMLIKVVSIHFSLMVTANLVFDYEASSRSLRTAEYLQDSLIPGSLRSFHYSLWMLHFPLKPLKCHELWRSWSTFYKSSPRDRRPSLGRVSLTGAYLLWECLSRHASKYSLFRRANHFKRQGFVNARLAAFSGSDELGALLTSLNHTRGTLLSHMVNGGRS
jgi:hypothetical protein